EKAVSADPKSATAYIALSYAQQAFFDLDNTLQSLRTAVDLEPSNALARARLAELWLSVGYLDKAVEEANEAVNLNPDLARAQSVLGFAHLTQIKTREAERVFEKAIKLDSADPLSRFGLGLAKIRASFGKAELKGGRREIEIAACLDPNNSLIRSYLGKAYFDEKRDKLASEQFDLASSLDPNDPTPLFYNAIRKQTVNRPVEALHDMQKSIELNDNRAVYRSKFLLDEDLGARSAGVARIYRDLGFQQRALFEGWRSLNVDPASYSAHRFLADSYSTLPRHEVARVSELLQSQLLQPINITPVQPQLAENNLFILEGAGPAATAFNEFNPLFNRNRLALQASGITADKHTQGDDIVQSGVLGRASYSLSQFHYETDGF
ncbi:MAG: tetratricopeptide repeat protein, partial [Gammaproteobacteria bacterium]|nr:tetratricopeptide repeat protein [Gammaproteobacteria bacterium]